MGQSRQAWVKLAASGELQARSFPWKDGETWVLVLAASSAGWPLSQNLKLSGEKEGHGSYSLLYLFNQLLLSLRYVLATVRCMLGRKRAFRAAGHYASDSQLIQHRSQQQQAGVRNKNYITL